MTTFEPGTDRSSWGPLIGAVFLDTCALLPIGLFGALSVVVLRDLHASASAAGLVVGTFFLCGALTVTALGPAVDRLGWRFAALSALVVTAAACLGAAAVTEHWWLLLPCLGAAGAASSIIQTASSVYLTSTVKAGRRGFAMSAKFAGVPASLTMSGAAVPLLAARFGWRVTFVAAAGAVLVGVLLVWLLGSRREPAADRRTEHQAHRVRRALLRSGIAMFLGSMLSGVLLGFTTSTLVRTGWSTSQAGVIFAGLSLLAIAARVLVAVTADRHGHDASRTVGLMLLVGGIGALLVASGSGPGVLVGSALAFSFGWGWTGEAFHMALRAHPDNPGAAASVIQSGGMFGSAAGPLLGAPIDHRVGHAAVWLIVGCACLAASAMSVRRIAPQPDIA